MYHNAACFDVSVYEDGSYNASAALLQMLPCEVIFHICSFLEAKLLLRSFSLVCKRFHHILSDANFWRARLHRRWPKKYPPVPGLHCHFVYKLAVNVIDQQVILQHLLIDCKQHPQLMP